MFDKIKVQLGDDNNRNYKRVVEIELSRLAIISLRHCEGDYDAAWDQMLDAIEDPYRDLPRSWFVDKVLF